MNSTPLNKILVVDDTQANIALLSEILEHNGYQICAAKDGEQAMKIANHVQPDLILLDIMMPGMDGFETCRQLKDSENTQHIPVIFISAKSETTDVVTGFNVGAVDYINKPFQEEEILVRIESQLKIQSLNRKLTQSEMQMRHLLIKYQNQSKRLQQIVTNVVDGILETTSTGIIQLVNPAIESLFGYKEDELYLLNFTELLAEPYSSQYQRWLARKTSVDTIEQKIPDEKMIELMGKRKDGSEFPIEFSFLKIPADEEIYLVVIRDISEHKDKEEKLRHLSYIDPLTQLANRRRFDESFSKEWLRSQRSEVPIAFIMIDLDLFKQYNDTYGHQAGDNCLESIANVIQKNIKRPSDIIARIGGEEFAIILPDTSKEGADRIALQLINSVKEIALPHSASVHGIVTISLGIACSSPEAPCQTSEILYKKADQALYKAKESGRNQYVIF